jgi:magnesium transporter
MLRKVVAVPLSATVLDACEFFIQHRFLALPVIDDAGKLVGLVDISLFTDEVFDVAEQHALNDVFQLIGLHLARDRKISAWEGFRSRFPWLLCNITAGILCALVASFFEKLLGNVVILALFVPMVLALSESVSMQTMTIVLQGLHEERVDLRYFLRALGREFLVALSLGLACGGMVALVSWLWKGNPLVAASLFVSISLAMLTASLLGVMLPLAIRALRVDPRIASGPIVLACGDLAALLFYFTLAGWLLG